MPEQFRFNVSVPGKSAINSVPKLSLGKAIDLIKLKGYVPDLEAQLIKAITKLPSNTYEGFFQEIDRHINKICKKA